MEDTRRWIQEDGRRRANDRPPPLERPPEPKRAENRNTATTRASNDQGESPTKKRNRIKKQQDAKDLAMTKAVETVISQIKGEYGDRMTDDEDNAQWTEMAIRSLGRSTRDEQETTEEAEGKFKNIRWKKRKTRWVRKKLEKRAAELTRTEYEKHLKDGTGKKKTTKRKKDGVKTPDKGKKRRTGRHDKDNDKTKAKGGKKKRKKATTRATGHGTYETTTNNGEKMTHRVTRGAHNDALMATLTGETTQTGKNKTQTPTHWDLTESLLNHTKFYYDRHEGHRIEGPQTKPLQDHIGTAWTITKGQVGVGIGEGTGITLGKGDTLWIGDPTKDGKEEPWGKTKITLYSRTADATMTISRGEANYW